jgi:CheY-like chemotaxis protein
MLTSAGRPDDLARCRRVGISACLVKPVKHSDLLDTFATLFGVPSRRARRQSAAPPGGRAARRSLRILVAEDNQVNRKLLTTLLRRRRHSVRAVENGRAALEALDSASRAFDLVLMDLQMPEMGGLEAAQAIRDRERTTRRHVPIIALTAHAMRGDRQRCLDAGMDGYLSKPIDVDDLIHTVEELGSAGSPRHQPAKKTARDSKPDVVFDERKALAHTGGDRQLLGEVIALFRSDAPAHVRRLGSALRRGNGEALRTAAHALKGVLATVASQRGRELAAQLEEAGRVGQFEHGTALFARLTDHLTLLDEAFLSAGFALRERRSRAAARPTRSRASPQRGRP